jgi:DNA-binding CsgD family transcriptional regulator
MSAAAEAAVRAARAALGREEDGPAGLEDVRELIAALSGRLGESGEGAAVAAAQAAHEERMAALREELAVRTGAADRVLRAVASLRAITAPPAMLQAAPRALAEGSRLDRVILSVPREGALVAEAVHVRGEAEAASRMLDALAAHPMPLEHPLLETEALRRRRATLVPDAATNPRVDRGTAGITGWDAYVVAPVAVRSTVVAVLHADRGPGGALEPRDASVLWTFASGLAQAYESASLRRTLRGERRQMRQLLTWLDGRSGELADASIGLVPRRGSDVPLPEEMEGHEDRRTERDAGPVLDAVLTRREIEILKLLADGLTNRAIAAELVISGGTVKFHVNSILRKLRVANRAEAVARYYALLDAGRR